MTSPWTMPQPPKLDADPFVREPTVLQRGLACGLISAAAVTGLLLGVGRRAGTAFRPLNATAHTILGTRADDVWGFHGVVTVTGVVVVLVVSAVAGVVAARLAPWNRTFRTIRAVAAAAGVALVGYLLHLHVAARSPGGLSALLSLGELRALYVTLAITLVLGMRFAFSPGTGADRY